MQLVAYGAQDIYLTGNPQITFFKVVYRRHTNFAVESIEQTFNGSPDFGKRTTATISRNGDLVQQMYLEVSLPQACASESGGVWTYGIGNALIYKAEIEIGGQLIDRHYGEWMDIWTELSTPEGKQRGYDDMVGNWYYSNDSGGQETYARVDYSYKLYIPLQFWFNRNPGLALPLIALQYHEVKLNLDIRNETELYNVDNGLIPITDFSMTQRPTIRLYVDYVYLDTDERRRFAQVSHEYLIEQVQFTGDETVSGNTTSKNVTLNFNHPCKELIWVHVSSRHSTAGNQSTGNRWLNFAPYYNSYAPECDSFGTAKLQLNGHDRFSEREASYFRKVQNYEHHTRIPRTLDYIGWNNNFVGPSLYQYIYTYSFSLSPEEHQPSGTCNFSRIDNAVLQITYPYTTPNNFNDTLLTNPTIDATLEDASNPLNLKVFAVNYNVLRIMSGMGGLAYSN